MNTYIVKVWSGENRYEGAQARVVEGGALLITDDDENLVVAFPPHAWFKLTLDRNPGKDTQ